jgi:peptidoglycan-N-acetylglucosamine deacetylase
MRTVWMAVLATLVVAADGGSVPIRVVAFDAAQARNGLHQTTNQARHGATAQRHNGTAPLGTAGDAQTRHKTSGTLYLSFDADMTPGMLRRLRSGEVASWYDPAIVQYLRDNEIPAVIFVSGLFAETYPDLIERLARDPLFAIGAHGYRHAAFTANCYGLPFLHTDAERLDDLTHARDTIARITGRAPTLFRYPGLCRDAHDDALVRQAGLTVDTPTVVAGDSFNHDVDAIVRQVIRQARDGGTVIFHLGGPNAPVTLEALKRVVPELRKQGYEFARK